MQAYKRDQRKHAYEGGKQAWDSIRPTLDIYDYAKYEPELGSCSGTYLLWWHVSLIQFMLVQNWNKSTYLGPSNFGIWATQTKEKIGFVKPVVSEKTRKIGKTLSHFLGKSYQIFPVKILSWNPNNLP